MVRPLPRAGARARRDFGRDGRQGQDREAQRRRESEYGLEIWRDVDPDADDLQGRRDGLAPGRRRAEAEAAAVDHRCGLIRWLQINYSSRPANSRPFALDGHAARAPEDRIKTLQVGAAGGDGSTFRRYDSPRRRVGV